MLPGHAHVHCLRCSAHCERDLLHSPKFRPALYHTRAEGCAIGEPSFTVLAALIVHCNGGCSTRAQPWKCSRRLPLSAPSVRYSDRRAVQAIGRIDRGADQNEVVNRTLSAPGGSARGERGEEPRRTSSASWSLCLAAASSFLSRALISPLLACWGDSRAARCRKLPRLSGDSAAVLYFGASGAGSSRGGDRLVRESTELPTTISVPRVVRHAAQRAPRRMLQGSGMG